MLNLYINAKCLMAKVNNFFLFLNNVIAESRDYNHITININSNVCDTLVTTN